MRKISRKVPSQSGSKKATAAPAVKRRTGRGKVRAAILELLSKGDMSRPAILKRGKFSRAALDMHVKTLREEGLVKTDARNRILGLVSPRPARGEVLIGEIVDDVAPSRRATSLVPAEVSVELRQALAAVSSRMTPIARATEKLVVLDGLARTMPAPIAELLREVMDDLSGGI